MKLLYFAFDWWLIEVIFILRLLLSRASEIRLQTVFINERRFDGYSRVARQKLKAIESSMELAHLFRLRQQSVINLRLFASFRGSISGHKNLKSMNHSAEINQTSWNGGGKREVPTRNSTNFPLSFTQVERSKSLIGQISSQKNSRMNENTVNETETMIDEIKLN